MEVHHHPKTEKKNFKEYFLEFLMIFIAVSMGFFAESLREHLLDKEKEKQSIQSIIKSIANDTAQLRFIEYANARSLMFLDKTLKLKDSDIRNPGLKMEFYVDLLNGAYYDAYFNSNNTAFQQLQSTGSLRLINNQHIIDSIFQYQQNTSQILRQENDHYFFTKNVWNEISSIMDVTFLRDTSNKVDISRTVAFIESKGKGVLLNYNSKTITKLFNDVTALALSTQFYKDLIHGQFVYGSHLIGLLKNQYHLENESN
jgi:hypothetical protein